MGPNLMAHWGFPLPAFLGAAPTEQAPASYIIKQTCKSGVECNFASKVHVWTLLLALPVSTERARTAQDLHLLRPGLQTPSMYLMTTTLWLMGRR